ncbi:MAG: hypothetical protein GXY18_10000 [Methanomicrobiales archaeon]|nr:hypothetical protein [Methanomicrobiales archaeon]
MNFVRHIPDSNENRSHKENRIAHDLPILFLPFIPLVIIVPVLPADFSSRFITVFFVTLLFITGIYSMRGDRRRFLISCILALIATETFWVSVWPAASSLFLPAEFFLLLFLIHQTRYLVEEMVWSDGTIYDLFGMVTALIITGGIMLGTSLHLAGWISRSVEYDPLTIHSSFAQALPEGILLLIRGGESPFGVSPLASVILMVGSVCGFLLLVLSAGKAAGYYVKNREQ